MSDIVIELMSGKYSCGWIALTETHPAIDRVEAIKLMPTHYPFIFHYFSYMQLMIML